MELENEIYFYGLQNEFNYMSNFYWTSFKDEDGIIYNCSEQYLMYWKCKTFEPNNDVLLNSILSEKSPSIIKKYGRRVKNYDDTIWEEKRYNIMLKGLRLKFNQNKIIKDKLIKTNPKKLFEASKYDKIWGIGYYAIDAIKTDKSKFGRNLLGNALMEIRNELLC
jgi:ribA/ribD-fused uncharacterized protein